MRKKHILIAIAVCLVLWGLTLLGQKMMMSGIPPFIIKKTNELLEDKQLIKSIGGYRTLEIKFNSYDYEARDTVNYTIIVIGNTSRVIYRASQVTVNANWKPVSDTLYIEAL